MLVKLQLPLLDLLGQPASETPPHFDMLPRRKPKEKERKEQSERNKEK